MPPRIDIATISNQKVLLRVAYDIPSLDHIYRINETIKTIQLLLSNNNQLVLLSHWGRPKGKDPEYSIKKQFKIIQRIISDSCNISQESIIFFDQYSHSLSELTTHKEAKVIVLENTRYDHREQANEKKVREDMALEYSKISSVFIDEAFPLSHRDHATNSTIKQFLPYSLGVSYLEEITKLDILTHTPNKPFILIMGGAKLETKIPLLEKLLPSVDYVLIGGLLSFTFLKSIGKEFEGGIVEEEMLTTASHIHSLYSEKIILPQDYVRGTDKKNRSGLYDIGQTTIDIFASYIAQARTVFWNGPMGWYEGGYAHGTRSLAEYIIENKECYSVIGGGDIVSSLPVSMHSKFGFVSTGGGASLDYIAQNT